MKASEVMDPQPSTLRPNATIRTAVSTIMQHRYRNLPVVDDAGIFLGVFGVTCLVRLLLPKAVSIEHGLTTVPFVAETMKDLRRRLADIEDQPVSAYANSKVSCVNPETPLVETLLILYHDRNSIPVVTADTGHLVGMISYWDVLSRVLAQEL
jgi:CBS-domain-containing membrane protein